MPEHPIEVEFKFPVASLESLRDRLVAMGAQPISSTRQVDEYLNDPLRDFAKLDIALRIRQVGDTFCLTFKGPNQDPTAKIRTEIETQLLDRESADKIKSTFLGIGFFSVAAVAKERETLKLSWEQHEIEICLDRVDQVGDFAELEQVVATSSQMPEARDRLQRLADKLELKDSTRVSYLAMLLKSQTESSPQAH